MRSAHFECDNAIRHSHSRVVVRVNAQRHIEPGLNIADNLLYLIRHRAAIRIAQDEHLGSACLCCQQCFQRVFGIGFVTVKKVLGIVNNFSTIFFQPGARILNNLQILVQCRPQHIGHVKRPAFPKERDGLCSRLEQRGKGGIVFGRIVNPACTAKGDNFCIVKIEIAHAVKKFEILGIRRIRPTAFDIVNAHRIEMLCNHRFVFSGKRNTLGLRAVSKGRIVDLYKFRHVIPLVWVVNLSKMSHAKRSNAQTNGLRATSARIISPACSHVRIHNNSQKNPRDAGTKKIKNP